MSISKRSCHKYLMQIANISISTRLLEEMHRVSCVWSFEHSSSSSSLSLISMGIDGNDNDNDGIWHLIYLYFSLRVFLFNFDTWITVFVYDWRSTRHIQWTHQTLMKWMELNEMPTIDEFKQCYIHSVNVWVVLIMEINSSIISINTTFIAVCVDSIHLQSKEIHFFSFIFSIVTFWIDYCTPCSIYLGWFYCCSIRICESAFLCVLMEK